MTRRRGNPTPFATVIEASTKAAVISPEATHGQLTPIERTTLIRDLYEHQWTARGIARQLGMATYEVRRILGHVELPAQMPHVADTGCAWLRERLRQPVRCLECPLDTCHEDEAQGGRPLKP